MKSDRYGAVPAYYAECSSYAVIVTIDTSNAVRSVMTLPTVFMYFRLCNRPSSEIVSPTFNSDALSASRRPVRCTAGNPIFRTAG